MKLVGKAFKGNRNGADGVYVVAGYLDEFDRNDEDEPEFDLDCEWMTSTQARQLANKLMALAEKADKMAGKLCKNHPTYQAKRAPTADCEACWAAWDKSWNNAARNGGQ